MMNVVNSETRIMARYMLRRPRSLVEVASSSAWHVYRAAPPSRASALPAWRWRPLQTSCRRLHIGLHNGLHGSRSATRFTQQCLTSFVLRRIQIRGFNHEVLANDDIPFARVRVVDDQGLVGDFNLGEAKSLARLRGTDLVVISGMVQPPLCRLVPLDAYIAELDEKAANTEAQRLERWKKEFSFDPAMKVKGMRFSAVIDEPDLERKVNRIRDFLEKGHRVEARIVQGRATAEDVLDLGLRICAELRDLAKPENLEESVKELRAAVNAPKSKKRLGRDATSMEILRLRLWPCTPEQASTFQIPAHILGPRRRRGAAIVGIDDVDMPEDAWKLNRKPRQNRTGDKKSFRTDSL